MNCLSTNRFFQLKYKTCSNILNNTRCTRLFSFLLVRDKFMFHFIYKEYYSSSKSLRLWRSHYRFFSKQNPRWSRASYQLVRRKINCIFPSKFLIIWTQLKLWIKLVFYHSIHINFLIWTCCRIVKAGKESWFMAHCSNIICIKYISSNIRSRDKCTNFQRVPVFVYI